MKVTPIRTPIVRAGETSTAELVDRVLPPLDEGAVVAITSKVVSLCENRVVPVGQVPKQELVEQLCDSYLAEVAPHGFHFTVTRGILIPSAGIDESNGDGCYVLWPDDPQASANRLRRHLQERHDVRHVGVLITDSTSMPMRRGTAGICLAHSGFHAVNDYVGQPDLFGRRYRVSRANVASGLAAAAVVSMGEGAERTPLCLLDDIPTVRFQDRDPSQEELAEARIEPDEDVFGPFLGSLAWKKGRGSSLGLSGPEAATLSERRP